MYLASVSSCPFRPVLLTLSDPARSTRWSLERRSVAEPGSRLHKWTVKIQWERVDAWFIGVWREERRVVREHFCCNTFIFLGLCESILKPLKSGHMADKKKRTTEFYSPSAVLSIFKQQKTCCFLWFLFFLSPAGLKIKATPCVTDEQ